MKIEHDLRFSLTKGSEESKQLGQRLYEMMMATEVSGVNEVFVGHTSNLMQGLGIWPKPEGVITVFQKKNDGLVYKGMIKPGQWFSLRK